MRLYLILFVLLLCVGIVFFLAPVEEYQSVSQSHVLEKTN